MNLGDAKRDYLRILTDFVDLASSGKDLSQDDALEAERRLAAVHKDTMRKIDQYTTRRFLSVNTRRGLVAKLDQLHQQAHSEFRAINKRQQGRHTGR